MADRLLFPPTTVADMRQRGWDAPDFVYVSGDAYVDHPSFGVPLLGRWLVGHGYRVGIVAQPRWKDEGIHVFFIDTCQSPHARGRRLSRRGARPAELEKCE